MPVKKHNKEPSCKQPVGRPTEYRQEYNVQVEKLCKLGATDKEIADFFEVTEATINVWKHKHTEFVESIKKGKMLADLTVSESLYKKATGYDQEAVKIFQFQGEPVVVPYVEKYQPDTTAMIFWLKNRQPKKWRDKQEVELSGEINVITVKPPVFEE